MLSKSRGMIVARQTLDFLNNDSVSAIAFKNLIWTIVVEDKLRHLEAGLLRPLRRAFLPRQRRNDPTARGNAPGTRPKQTLPALKGRNSANQRCAEFGAENQMIWRLIEAWRVSPFQGLNCLG